MDQSTYRRAVSIYLRHAYPINTDMKSLTKMRLLDNPNFWDDGEPPSEYRFGCHVNGHMKIKVKDGHLMVFPNDIQESEKVQALCKNIKEKIEDDWEAEGLPVYRQRR